MNKLKIMMGLVSFVTGLILYLHKQKYLTEGEQKAIADALRIQAEEMDRARNARATALRNAQLTPANKPLADDGFRRD